MRTLAAAAIFLILLALACLFLPFPTELVVTLWLLPFLIGATAAVCSRKWGWRAIAVGVAVILIPAGGAIVLLRTAYGVKMGIVLAMVVVVPFFGAVVMARLAEPVEARHEGSEL
jgi:hypothetical protein